MNIYEHWFVVKDQYGLDYLYYSDVRSVSFQNSVPYRREEYAVILTERMKQLLNREIEIVLNYQNVIENLPIVYSISYRQIRIAEYCGNYMELNRIRNAICYIDRFDISGIQIRCLPDGSPELLIETDQELYRLPVEEGERSSLVPRRNYSLINKDLIHRLSIQKKTKYGGCMCSA